VAQDDMAPASDCGGKSHPAGECNGYT
jgi:hypothetical protein